MEVNAYSEQNEFPAHESMGMVAYAVQKKCPVYGSECMYRRT